MKKKELVLPPKPECGSIEQNKIIRAINDGKPNPCTENDECVTCYNEILKEKQEYEQQTGKKMYFDLVEPDYYEDAIQESMIEGMF